MVGVAYSPTAEKALPVEKIGAETPRRDSARLAFSIVVAASIIGGCIIWTGVVVGREIRCAGYLSSNTGSDTWQVVAMRRLKGDPIGEERTFLAPAALAGCFVPRRKE